MRYNEQEEVSIRLGVVYMPVPEIDLAVMPDRLRQLRLEYGWTLGHVATVTGVAGRQVVGNWETGKRTPELRTLLLLCAWYGCSLDYLVGKSQRRDSDAVDTAKDLVERQLLQVRLPDAPSDRFRLVYNQLQRVDAEAFFPERVATYLLVKPETLGAYTTAGLVPAETIQRFSALCGFPLAWFYSRFPAERPPG